MEELRSTEAIDNEIRNESRKKAVRIIEKAHENAAALAAGVDERVAQAAENARLASDRKLGIYERNITASLPLEKQRYLVSYINGSVVSAINEYFKSLGEDGCLEVIGRQLERAVPVVGGRKVNVFLYNLDDKKARSLLKKHLGDTVEKVSAAPESDLYEEAVPGFELRKGLVLQTEDRKIKCSLTLDQRVKEILDEKNLELAVALFGGRLPE